MTDLRDLKKSDDLSLLDMAEVIISEQVQDVDLYSKFRGSTFTDENGKEHEVYINNRSYGVSPQWRKIGSRNRQILAEDKSKQTAEDWTSIPMTSCRCCKKENVQKYSEKYFEKYFDHWTLFCFENGYCQECAQKKTDIIHPKPELLKEEWVRVRSYEVGGENFTFRTDKFGNVWYWK